MVFQLGSSLLDACVLSIIKENDTYGYVLTQRIQEIIDISESTLYPVLRRLQKDECVTTYDQPFQGRNRRYYAITSKGVEKSNYYISEWSKYKDSVDKILGGVSNE